MKKIALLLGLSMLLSLFTACGNSELIGVWQGQRDGVLYEISFEKDGVCGVKQDGRSYLGTWETAEGKLTVTADEVGNKLTVLDGAEYTVNGNTLTVKIDGRDVTLTKQ